MIRLSLVTGCVGTQNYISWYRTARLPRHPWESAKVSLKEEGFLLCHCNQTVLYELPNGTSGKCHCKRQPPYCVTVTGVTVSGQICNVQIFTWFWLLTFIEICSKGILGWCVCVCGLKVSQHACAAVEDEKVAGIAWCSVGVAQGCTGFFVISNWVEGSINVFVFDAVGRGWRGKLDSTEAVIWHNT